MDYTSYWFTGKQVFKVLFDYTIYELTSSEKSDFENQFGDFKVIMERYTTHKQNISRWVNCQKIFQR